MVCAFKRHALKRYSFLNVYMGASCILSIVRFKFLIHYGYSSTQYFHFYYYSDALLTIGLYFALITLYSEVLKEKKAESMVRLAALLLLAGTAWFSYQVIQQSTPRLLTRFVVELSQNLYFVGVVLTYLLWGAMMKLQETRTRLVQLVLSLGVYFSAFAANYALRNVYPGLHGPLMYMLPLTGMWLPAAWTYAFLCTPEDVRLVPAKLMLTRR